jgi:hypothetical protein
LRKSSENAAVKPTALKGVRNVIHAITEVYSRFRIQPILLRIIVVASFFSLKTITMAFKSIIFN